MHLLFELAIPSPGGFFLLASAVEALKILGDARAIAVLVTGKCTMQLWDSDYGIDSWHLFISLPVHLFYAISEDERKSTEGSIEEVMRPFFSSTPCDSLASVMLSPLVVEAQDGWREEALRFVKGVSVWGQVKRQQHRLQTTSKRLLFRSKAEITIFRTHPIAKLAVAPLPVFVRIGKAYNRLEPDFVVVFKGLTFVVEVDGDTFHRELPQKLISVLFH
ncbi:MAG: hypothetical protein U1E47_09050 [Rivihabitans pingtungensis]